MSLFFEFLSTVKTRRNDFVILVFCGLVLNSFPFLEAFGEGDSCMLKENIRGVCKATSKCQPHLEKYFQTGTLVGNDVPSCGLGIYEEIICCPIAECCQDEPSPETTTTRTIQPTPTNQVNIEPKEERPAVRACQMFERGKVYFPLSPHILGGVEVDDGIYPHMAAIGFGSFGNIEYLCGGSLISRRHVLTAAHCFNMKEVKPVHVRLGTVNIAQVNANYQDIAITSNISIHPEYVSNSKYNDIAILELVEDAKLSYFIYPACLETNIADPPVSSKVLVAGWGVPKLDSGGTSKVLLRAALNVVSLDRCNALYAENPFSPRYIKHGIIDSLLCAADLVNLMADACDGDSGGPLMIEHDSVNQNYTILGIVVAGIRCASPTPGLYTRVASYLDFIESVVWPNNVV